METKEKNINSMYKCDGERVRFVCMRKQAVLFIWRIIQIQLDIYKCISIYSYNTMEYIYIDLPSIGIESRSQVGRSLIHRVIHVFVHLNSKQSLLLCCFLRHCISLMVLIFSLSWYLCNDNTANSFIFISICNDIFVCITNYLHQ